MPTKHKEAWCGSIKMQDKEYYQGPRWLLPNDYGANSSERHTWVTWGKFLCFSLPICKMTVITVLA